MANQPYLEILYKAILCLSYYGLLRVGEVSDSRHNIKALNVHIASNKQKILILLYSSKTHDKESRPQEVKISGSEITWSDRKFFCPFQVMRTFIKARGDVTSDQEPFFVFSDRSLVPANTLRVLLHKLLWNLNLQPEVFNFQSMRIGRATDMLIFGFTIEQIKRMGLWKSNVVYQYIRPWY